MNDKEDKKKKELKGDEKSGALNLDELEKLSGGGGLHGAATSKTHDLPEGSTK